MYGRKSENPGLFNRYPTNKGAAQKQAIGDAGELKYSKGGGHSWAGQTEVVFVELWPSFLSLSKPQNWDRMEFEHKGFPWSLKKKKNKNKWHDHINVLYLLHLAN